MTTRSKVVFLFYIKRTKLLQNGEAPIYLKIKVGKQSAELAIFKSVPLALWNVEKNGASGTSKEAKDVNSFIDYVRQQMIEHLAYMREEGMEITAYGLKNAFLGIKTEEKSIVSVFEDHNKSLELLKNKEYAESTCTRYDTCLSHLKTYMKDKFHADDLPLSKVDAAFINGFEFFLKTKKNCCKNTSLKYLSNLHKIVSICFGNGWMKKDPYANFSFDWEKVEKEFLSEDELLTIRNKKFSCERLQQVADTFLFACFTGYAYTDLKKLTPENLVKTESDQLWIHAKRTKTGIDSHVPVLPIALSILDKYKTHPYCIKNNVLLPVLSNQKQNAYLKEIADLCGINKNMTTHTARHTFATIVTLNNDIPIESVSKMLGHCSISMTQKYAKLLDKKVGKDMSKLYGKFTAENFNACSNG